MITSKEIVNLETKINALLFCFRSLKKARGTKSSAYWFKGVKRSSRSIHTLMHKLETADDKLKDR